MLCQLPWSKALATPHHNCHYPIAMHWSAVAYSRIIKTAVEKWTVAARSRLVGSAGLQPDPLRKSAGQEKTVATIPTSSVVSLGHYTSIRNQRQSSGSDPTPPDNARDPGSVVESLRRGGPYARQTLLDSAATRVVLHLSPHR